MPPEQSDSSVMQAGGTPPAPEPEPAGDLPAAASHAVARLIALEEGFYAFTIVGAGVWAGAAPGFAVPAVHISAPPDRVDGLDITDIHGEPAAWLGARHATVFLRSPAGGASALVTTYPARDPARPPVSLEIRRLDATGFAAPLPEQEHPDNRREGIQPIRQPPLATLVLADPVPAPANAEEVQVEIIAHVRGRGDVRFVDAPWAGRLGAGFWIESFSILPRHRLAAETIEYKGLTAAGDETEWLGSGSPCGTRGVNTPLVGFAVRQKAIAATRCSTANTPATSSPERLSALAATGRRAFPPRQTIRWRAFSCASSNGPGGQPRRGRPNPDASAAPGERDPGFPSGH